LVSLEDLSRLLDDYYAERGWDSEGRPTEEKLKELGLSDMLTLVRHP